MSYITQLSERAPMSVAQIIARVLTVLVLVVTPAITVQAQWATNGNNISNTNTGNVGVGTTTPEVGLHVATESTATPRGVIIQQSNAGNNSAFLILRKSRGTIASPGAIVNGDSLGAIYSEAHTGSAYLRTGANIKFLSNGTVAAGSVPTDIAFSTGSSGTGTEYMRITSAGNVGIGTTNPAWGRLQVNKSIRIDDDSGSATGSDTFTGSANLYLGTTTGGNAFQFNGNGGLDLWQYNAAAWARTVTFARTGNVGIGTTSPGFKLDVQGGSLNSSGGLCIAGDCKTAWSQVGGSQWTTSGFNIYYNSGNVGVGTATPNKSSVSKALTVNGSTDAIYELAIGDTRKGNMYHDGTNLSVYNNANGALTLGTNNNERFRVDASGNVGIGTTSPSSKLHVVGDGTITGNLTVTGNIAAKYQDVAEWVQSSQELAAGTVVVLDQTKSNQVIASSQAYDTRVAGVISLQPGITLGENGAGKVLVATTGRVKVRVDASAGPIHVGDLLVTSDKEGLAKKSEPLSLGGVQIHRPGTLIGKALEPLAQGTGEILVLLTLQ